MVKSSDVSFFIILGSTAILLPNFICSYWDACFLRDFTKVIINPATAISRITGSASIKIGIVPDVSVTIVDENKTRQIPDANIAKLVRMFCFIRPII